METTNFDILDCTLRDGSYVNHFQFTSKDTSFLCEQLEKIGIKYIEIGHGLGLGASRKKGLLSAATTDEGYLKAAAKVLSKASFGMFCIPDFATLDDLDLAHSYNMNFLRIGSNVTEVEKTASFIERAKKHGMFVCANYMKSYAVSPSVFAQKAKLSKSYGADLVYLVDSAGGMLPDEVERYITTLKESVDIAFGYHGHDNLGLSISNSLLAQKLGARFIDTTLQGMGRSAGNASTEQMILTLSRAEIDLGVDLHKLIDLGFEHILPLLEQKGLNPIDLISGYALFHSSYLPVIKKYANQYCVDPKELIIELCKVDQINAPSELVQEIASKLTPTDKAISKYHLENYYVNEQQ